MTIDSKFEKLKDILTELGSAVVAFSGGVDSTFLLKTARDVLGAEGLLRGNEVVPGRCALLEHALGRDHDAQLTDLGGGENRQNAEDQQNGPGVGHGIPDETFHLEYSLVSTRTFESRSILSTMVQN